MSPLQNFQALKELKLPKEMKRLKNMNQRKARLKDFKKSDLFPLGKKLQIKYILILKTKPFKDNFPYSLIL
jgi:hypothetical protein